MKVAISLPRLGSYDPADVTFLLTDVSDRIVESSLVEREEAIRAGMHYSERLPIEYVPSSAYMEHFEAALERNAERVAQSVAVVSERIIAKHREPPVLVSLARAGTPAGILIRRYLAFAHSMDVSHYSVSIIRGRGLDPVAVHWLARRHPLTRLQFIDGWTGKGAIQRELTAARSVLGIDDEMAVLADPGYCAALSGTNDDFLIPSACLNATVSGLLSRTILREDLIGDEDFHGVKMYPELAEADVSRRFIDTVAARFSRQMQAEARSASLITSPRPNWSGWAAVRRIGTRFGIADPNRIKPGVGESTRVLLRRQPWRLLLSSSPSLDLGHLVQLADERGVEIERYDDMPYAACGLIA